MTQVQRWLSDAQRFGLTPEKLISRAVNRNGPRVVANSLPKAGTHLLERALCQHPRLYRAPVRTLHRRTIARQGSDFAERVAKLKANQMLVTHLEYSSERADIIRDHGIRTLFMIRDPRDIVVSQAHFIGQKETHAHHALFATTPDLSDRIALVIEGSPTHGFSSLQTRLESFAPWLESDALVVRFEDLVGGAGGGDDRRQKEALAAIFAHIDLTLDGTDLENLATRVFSATSPTFRRGATGQWRDQFDDRATKLFNDLVGDIAARYGYPTIEPSPTRNED